MSSGTDDTISSFSDDIMYLMEHWNRKLDPTEVTPKDVMDFLHDAFNSGGKRTYGVFRSDTEPHLPDFIRCWCYWC